MAAKNSKQTKRKGNDSAHGDAVPKTYHKSLAILFISIAALLAYSNTFHAPFTFDDKVYIADNPLVKDLSYYFAPWKADDVFIPVVDVRENFKTRFVAFFTFAVNYRLGGLNVLGYHLVNLLIHIGNGLIIWRLVNITFKIPYCAGKNTAFARYAAFFAGLIFVCHPVETQAVTYVSQRFTSLAALLYLASVFMYAKWRIENRRRLYAASFIFAVAAMFTKESAFTLPVAIALYEFSFFTGAAKKRLTALAPIFCAMLIIPVVIGLSDRPAGQGIGNFEQIYTRYEYFITQFAVMATYLRLLFAPYGQNIDYDFPVYHSALEPGVLLSLAALLLIAGAGVWLFKKDRLAAFGIFWFFITLSVESSFIPLSDLIYEYRVYLPSVGIIVAFAALVSRLGKKAMPALVIISVALGAATYARNDVWRNGVTLWSDAVAKSPNKARPRYNLGVELGKANRPDEAMREYQAAIRIKPGYAAAHTNLGLIYYEKRMFAEAISEQMAALNAKPDFAEAHVNLGLVYGATGRWDDAVKEYDAALSINPKDADTLNNLAVAYHAMNRLDDAIAKHREAIALSPDDAVAHYSLGTMYLEKGLRDDAIREFARASILKPDFDEARFALGSLGIR